MNYRCYLFLILTSFMHIPLTTAMQGPDINDQVTKVNRNILIGSGIGGVGCFLFALIIAFLPENYPQTTLSLLLINLGTLAGSMAGALVGANREITLVPVPPEQQRLILPPPQNVIPISDNRYNYV